LSRKCTASHIHVSISICHTYTHSYIRTFDIRVVTPLPKRFEAQMRGNITTHLNPPLIPLVLRQHRLFDFAKPVICSYEIYRSVRDHKYIDRFVTHTFSPLTLVLRQHRLFDFAKLVICSYGIYRSVRGFLFSSVKPGICLYGPYENELWHS